MVKRWHENTTFREAGHMEKMYHVILLYVLATGKKTLATSFLATSHAHSLPLLTLTYAHHVNLWAVLACNYVWRKPLLQRRVHCR